MSSPSILFIIAPSISPIEPATPFAIPLTLNAPIPPTAAPSVNSPPIITLAPPANPATAAIPIMLSIPVPSPAIPLRSAFGLAVAPARLKPAYILPTSAWFLSIACMPSELKLPPSSATLLTSLLKASSPSIASFPSPPPFKVVVNSSPL